MEAVDAARRTLEERVRSLELENRQYDPHFFSSQEGNTVRLNLINHVLALFHDKFACNIALRNLVFRWESCKGSV